MTSRILVSSDTWSRRLMVSPGPPGPFISDYKMFRREIVFKKRKNFFGGFGLDVNSPVARIME